MTDIKKLSIIIPAYNEEETIHDLLKRVISSRISIDKEIIIVDDGSTDKTSTIAKQIASHNKNILLIRKKNGGKGSAIKEGLKHVTGELVIIQDADLEYDPDDYQRIIDPILRDEADVVYGSRWLNPQNAVQGLDFFFGGKVLTWVTQFLYPRMNITDEPTCYKCFKTKILNKLHLQSHGFEFCPEVTAKLARSNWRFVEVPITYFPRNDDEGKKIRTRDGAIAIKVLLKYSNIFRQLWKFSLIGGFGALIHICVLWLLTEQFGMWYISGTIIAAIIGAIWTFTMYRMWAFR